MSVSKLKRTSKQNLFNMMWRGLKGQGWEQSNESHGGCMYRGRDGNKCAIGHCISDSVANTWDDSGQSSISDILWDEGVSASRIQFLHSAQRAHDKALSRTPASMELAFRQFAEDHNLSIPEDT